MILKLKVYIFLTDDTILFMQDKDQQSYALTLVEQFSSASGLTVNISKCEILPLHECDDSVMKNIAVKHTVEYLWIHIKKMFTDRQQLNYTAKIAQTENMFNSWLQREWSMFGRSILSKADSLSHFVYPSLSLFIKGVIDCRTEFTLSQLNNDSSVGKMDI